MRNVAPGFLRAGQTEGGRRLTVPMAVITWSLRLGRAITTARRCGFWHGRPPGRTSGRPPYVQEVADARSSVPAFPNLPRSTGRPSVNYTITLAICPGAGRKQMTQDLGCILLSAIENLSSALVAISRSRRRIANNWVLTFIHFNLLFPLFAIIFTVLQAK